VATDAQEHVSDLGLDDDVGSSAAGRVVGLGAGPGWTAVEAVVRALPERAGFSVIAFADRADDDPAGLAARIDERTELSAVVAEDGMLLKPDRVYIVPRTRDAIVTDGQLRLIRDVHGARAPIDRLFRSLAVEHGRHAMGVVLSGNGVDGINGLKAIKEVGGLAIAQQPEEAEHDEMPRAAIASGLVDVVLPAWEIAQRLMTIGHASNDLLSLLDDRRTAAVSETLRDILAIVRVRSGHDFSSYKRATLVRRIVRRMQVCQTETIAQYHKYLRDHPQELASLLRDFLISVTSFFRDPESYAALARDVIPSLFAGKTSDDHVRVWVAGCATGEEAYSLAMLLAEHAAQSRVAPAIQIFATDIDEGALDEARVGRYPDTIAIELGPRVERFFTKEGNYYRVRKELRETVLFSPHNVLRDPPFSRLDLISCRNLLIYLNRDAQEKILSVFHFGLRQDGYLFLGSSESAETRAMHFASIDTKNRIYARRLVPTSFEIESLSPSIRWPAGHQLQSKVASDEQRISFGDLHHRVVEEYAPPSVIVDNDLDVLHVSERAGTFMTIGGGEPTRQLLRMVHPALRLDLRTIVYAARQPERPVQDRTVRYMDDGVEREVTLRVRSIAIPEHGLTYLLVMFDERAVDASNPPTPVAIDPSVEPVVRDLEDELHRTREQLRTTVEQYETSLEELKASNEELHAINEELRSATEELETSKEELQSVNEELTTLNTELKIKVEEVSRANSDLQNLMASTDIGVLFLDRNLHIKRFTERATDLFNVIASDIGRPIGHLTHKLEWSELQDDARRVIQYLETIERDVRATDGARFLARVLPYRSIDDRIDGVVITCVDVSELKAAEDALRQTERALREADRRKDEFLALLAHELRSPLAPLRSSLDLLGASLDRIPAEKRSDTIAAMNRQVDQITRLVDDLLDLSRITQGKIVLQRRHIVLDDVVRAARENVDDALAAAGHELVVDLPAPPLELEADYMRLTQVVTNLLANAIKYTPDGGRIAIVARADRARGELDLRVRDDGHGIEPAMLPRVFDIFAQSPDTIDVARGGLGIGLNLVKRAIELHGGTVEARSDGRDKGTELVIRIPLAAG
jgi:two-component system CheB/CheR fusion protein